jgi:hypothetical protein
MTHSKVQMPNSPESSDSVMGFGLVIWISFGISVLSFDIV